jgi:hypothetical protein
VRAHPSRLSPTITASEGRKYQFEVPARNAAMVAVTARSRYQDKIKIAVNPKMAGKLPSWSSPAFEISPMVPIHFKLLQGCEHPLPVSNSSV